MKLKGILILSLTFIVFVTLPRCASAGSTIADINLKISGFGTANGFVENDDVPNCEFGLTLRSLKRGTRAQNLHAILRAAESLLSDEIFLPIGRALSDGIPKMQIVSTHYDRHAKIRVMLNRACSALALKTVRSVVNSQLSKSDFAGQVGFSVRELGKSRVISSVHSLSTESAREAFQIVQKKAPILACTAEVFLKNSKRPDFDVAAVRQFHSWFLSAVYSGTNSYRFPTVSVTANGASVYLLVYDHCSKMGQTIWSIVSSAKQVAGVSNPTKLVVQRADLTDKQFDEIFGKPVVPQ